MPQYRSVFKDEGKLDLGYVPPRQYHLNLLRQFFRFLLERPGGMAQRVLISGRVGTGKTVLSQRFGLDVMEEAWRRGINLRYVHVNCRECRGSFFMILQRVILKFHPHFPRRGYSAHELLQILIQVLDEQDAHLILALDELEALIQREGADPLYSLTRVQEERMNAPQRLSLICILRDPAYLGRLDPGTRSTLQHNLIHLEAYSKPQLRDILNDRVELAFYPNTVPDEVVDFIAGLAASEGGDARYAIELLWRAGKYADAEGAPRILPEHVRKASASIYPTLKEVVLSLPLHERLFLLGVARRFKQVDSAYLSMGEAEEAYALVCEEFGERRRGHTQVWTYVKELSALGVLKTETSGAGRRGRTTLISLPRIPASSLEQELMRALGGGRGARHVG